MILMPARSGFRRVGGSAAAAGHSLSFRGRMSAQPASTTVHTFSQQPIGTPDAARMVIVACYCVVAGAGSFLGIDFGAAGGSSVIVGNSGSARLLTIAYGIIAGGTTVDISVSSELNLNNVELGYWTAIMTTGEDAFDGAFNFSTLITSAVTINYPSTSGFAVAMCIENANGVDQTQAIDKSFVERAENYTSVQICNAMYADRDPAIGSIGAVTHTLNAASAQNIIAVASFGA